MKDLTSGPIAKGIFRFAMPIVLGNVFMQFYQMVDAAIVGRFVGKQALAAVGASTPVVFMVVALVIGLSAGASVVISQYFGAKQYDKVRRSSDTLYIFLLATAVLVTAFGLVLSRWVLGFMDLEPDVLPMAVSYLKIYFSGSLLLFGFNSLSAILRGIGDSKTPLYFLVASAVLNVALDLLFVVSFGWGVEGAAWATVISQGAAFICGLLYVNRKFEVIRLHIPTMRFSKSIFKQMVNFGLPSGFQQTFVAIGNLALIRIVTGFGTDLLAAYTSAGRLDMIASIPAMNFGMALSSFVGQNMGAGRVDRARAGLWATLKMTWVISACLTLVIVIFGHDLMRIFTTDPEVIRLGRGYLVVVSSFYIIFATMFVVNGLLRGAGAVIVPMFTTLFSLWLVRIPLAAVLSQHWGPHGIWWAIPVGWFCGMVGAVVYYFTGKWKDKNVMARKAGTAEL